jgi:hypothetical protein
VMQEPNVRALVDRLQSELNAVMVNS